MSIFDIDPNSVEEPKDFSAVKPCFTRVRCVGAELVVNTAKEGREEIVLKLEYTNPESLEPISNGKVGGIKQVLYTHSSGALGMTRRAIQAFGLDWTQFIQSRDVNVLVGQEADVKVSLETKNKSTGEDLVNPRNTLSFLLPKA